MFIEINANSISKSLLVIAYRHPTVEYFQDFIDKLESCIHQYSFTFILGDLNCDLLKANYQSNQLHTFINDYSLYLVPTGPSFHLIGYESWLDVAIVSDQSKITSYSRTVNFSSNHDLLTIELPFSVPKEIHTTNQCRDWRNCDYGSLTHT